MSLSTCLMMRLASIRRSNVYLLWEVGKAPDFILEIGSPSTARNDLVGKRELYADIGVSEYWRYDSTGGDIYGESLVGESLIADEYRRIDMRYESNGRIWAHSEALNLDLWWIDGELRFWDCQAESWLLTIEEEHARAEEERADRIEAESRAEAAEAQLRILRARLAEMGEPE